MARTAAAACAVCGGGVLLLMLGQCCGAAAGAGDWAAAWIRGAGGAGRAGDAILRQSVWAG